MARSYDVTFSTPSGVLHVIRAHGNTQSVARRTAKRKLRELGIDPVLSAVIDCKFVKPT